MELILQKLKPDCKDRKYLEQINDEAFPDSERMTMDEMFAFSADTDTDVLGIYDGDMPIGFAMLVKNAECGYLYFLAIDNRFRGKGYGSVAIRKILAAYPQIQMILDFEEIEESAANYKQRVRRKQFYLKNGFLETGNYTMLNGNRFEVVCSGGSLRRESFCGLLTVLHARQPGFSEKLY